jgi:ornithine--oxo-acid transaminase
MHMLIDESYEGVTARRISRLAYQKGVLTTAFPGRLRLGVALNIMDKEMKKGMRIIKETLDEIQSYGEIPGST